MRVLPILFNTEMVRAILDGRKTSTRRLIKCKYSNTHLKMFKNKYGTRLIELQNNVEGKTFGTDEDGRHWQKLLAMREAEYDSKPYQKGDILYVRETYCPNYFDSNTIYDNKHGYKADYTTDVSDTVPEPKWTPSRYMPKAAARIWLKVTGVRVERLQDIMESPPGPNNQITREGCKYGCDFIALWNQTVDKKQLDIYGWSANPWVWVIEFERCEKPEEAHNDE